MRMGRGQAQSEQRPFSRLQTSNEICSVRCSSQSITKASYEEDTMRLLGNRSGRVLKCNQCLCLHDSQSQRSFSRRALHMDICDAHNDAKCRGRPRVAKTCTACRLQLLNDVIQNAQKPTGTVWFQHCAVFFQSGELGKNGAIFFIFF